MKKLLILLLLLMISTNVMSEWKPIGFSDEQTQYVDLESIRKKGNKVKLWFLLDLKKVKIIENKSILSIMGHEEYDCKEETTKVLDMFFYEGNMKNKEIFSEVNIHDEPTSIRPNTVESLNYKIACGKK
jgi:hypothetical protein